MIVCCGCGGRRRPAAGAAGLGGGFLGQARTNHTEISTWMSSAVGRRIDRWAFEIRTLASCAAISIEAVTDRQPLKLVTNLSVYLTSYKLREISTDRQSVESSIEVVTDRQYVESVLNLSVCLTSYKLREMLTLPAKYSHAL